MTDYIHEGTFLGPIRACNDGLEVQCTSKIRSTKSRAQNNQDIDFLFVNKTGDRAGGMDALIKGALAEGKALADAYIAARESTVPALEPRDFTTRTTIFSSGLVEAYVQDVFDPAMRRLTIASGVGTVDERHIVFPIGPELKAFLAAMAELHVTPFSPRPNYEEVA